MAATFSNAIANSMADVVGTSATHMSLHSGNPGITGASELSGDGYAREAISLASAADQAVENDASLAFGPAVLEWDEATYFGLWDAGTAGNFIAGGLLNDPVTVPALGDLTFASGAVVVSLKPLA